MSDAGRTPQEINAERRDKYLTRRREWYQKNKSKWTEYRKTHPLTKEEMRKRNKRFYCRHLEQMRERGRKYSDENKDKRLEYNRTYKKQNRLALLSKLYEYRKGNKAKVRKWMATWRSRHRDEINRYKREWRRKQEQTCIDFRIKSALRRRVYMAIKSGSKNGSAVRDLGCSIEEFKKHIEGMFKPGMTWENWGHRTWHLDHIKPLAAFDLSNRHQFLQACHYTNYQPLWSVENLSKGAKVA